MKQASFLSFSIRFHWISSFYLPVYFFIQLFLILRLLFLVRFSMVFSSFLKLSSWIRIRQKTKLALFKMFKVNVTNELGLLLVKKIRTDEARGNLLSLCVNFLNKIVPTCSWIVVHVFQTMQNLVISRCCFAEDGKEIGTKNHNARAQLLLIKPFD